MSRVKSWAAKAARSLSAHLDRLRDTLERVHGRLKEAVAEAVSGNVASAVKDAVLAALLAHEVPTTYERPSYRPYEQSRYRDDPYWPEREEDPYRPAWERDPYDDRYEPEERIDDEERTTEASPESAGRRWGNAVVMGCQAAAWWLRRKSNGRYSTLTAIGVGAAAGVTAFYCGPPIAAAAALAGSTLGLAAMADAARKGARILLNVGTS